jgi:uncharacterized protein with HEPN domain
VAVDFLHVGDLSNDAALKRTAFAAILYQIVVVGEAIRALPNEWMMQHPDAGWAKALAMRNVITHEYIRVDHATVHRTIGEPLARLRSACLLLLRDYGK